MEDQLMVFPAGESSSSTNLHHGFRTLGPAFTLRSRSNRVLGSDSWVVDFFRPFLLIDSTAQAT